MKHGKVVVIGFLLLILIAGLLGGLYLVRREQVVPKKAAVPTGTAQIRLNPETKTVSAGETFAVDIPFTTGGQPISAVTVELNYTYTGAQPPVSVSSIQLNSTLLATGEWSIPIKTFSAENGVGLVRIAAVNTSLGGYSSTTESVLSSLIFQGNSPGSITVTFNSTESKITLKASGQDNLLIPTSSGVYTVQAATASPTPTPTTGAGAPSPTPTPTTPAGAPSPTPTPTTGGSGLTCASLDIPGGTTRTVGTQIQFLCNGSPESLVSQCRFRFGDGTPETTDVDCDLSHTYTANGTYAVACDVRSIGGSWVTSTACGNQMTISSSTFSPTPTPPGGSTSTTVDGDDLPESGNAFPTVFAILMGFILLIVGAKSFLF